MDLVHPEIIVATSAGGPTVCATTFWQWTGRFWNFRWAKSDLWQIRPRRKEGYA